MLNIYRQMETTHQIYRQLKNNPYRLLCPKLIVAAPGSVVLGICFPMLPNLPPPTLQETSTHPRTPTCSFTGATTMTRSEKNLLLQ